MLLILSDFSPLLHSHLCLSDLLLLQMPSIQDTDSLVSRMAEILAKPSEYRSDVVLKTKDNASIQAHKNILAASSPFFKTAFGKSLLLLPSPIPPFCTNSNSCVQIGTKVTSNWMCRPPYSEMSSVGSTQVILILLFYVVLPNSVFLLQSHQDL
jgi:hypothetical protein